MEYYDGEEGHFESSHNEAEYDEPIQSWSDEEADYEAPPPWPGDDYSSSEVGQVDMVQLLTAIQGLGDCLTRLEQPQLARRRPVRRVNVRQAQDETDEDMNRTDDEPPPAPNLNQRQRGNDVKLTTPTFAGRMNPEAYLDWERRMEYIFEYYKYSEERKVALAAAQLTGNALAWWRREVSERRRHRHRQVNNWEDMRFNLRKRYVPAYYHRDLQKKFRKLTQGSPNTKEVSTHVIKEKHTSASQARDDTPKLAHRTVAQKPSTPVMREQQVKQNPSKSSNLSKSEEVTCYRCHKRGHYAATCPTRQVVTTSLIEPKMDNSKEVTKFNYELEFSKASNANQTKERDYLISFVSNDPKDLMMHLMCSKELEKDLGTKEEQLDLIHKVTFEENLKGEANCDVRDFIKGPTLLPKEFSNKSWRGVLVSSLIKEEPPDSPHQLHPSHNRDIYRGNCLTPQRIQNTNLTYRHADPTILRTKSIQGGGYDEVIKPEVEPKLNQTGCTMLNRPVIDICSLFESYQLNHEGSMHEFTWRIFSAQLQNSSKKNQVKRSSNEGVILFTNQLICSVPVLDIQALIGGLPQNQKDLYYKSTHSGILVQQRNFWNWIHDYTNFGLGVIQFLKQRMLDLPYLEPSVFERLQTYLWRPGDLFHQLETQNDLINVNKTHRISLKHSKTHLPYLDAFTLNAINHQRLVSPCCCVLETHSLNPEVRRHHTFSPKLSRLKHHPNLPYLARFGLILPSMFQRLYSLNFMILFLF